MIDVVLKEHLYSEGDPDIGHLGSAASACPWPGHHESDLVTLGADAIGANLNGFAWRLAKGQLLLAQDLKE